MASVGEWAGGDLRHERHDGVTVLTLARPQKRNALHDDLVRGLATAFAGLDAGTRCVVIEGDGDHFCAGLDLDSLSDRDTMAGIEHSQMWHRAFALIEGSGVPVVSALQGGVIGGGLELAAATHIRVADETTFYALPEGSRGLFVGGGGSVRIPRLIGTARMMDMMLTGRRYDAREGAAIGLSQYVVPVGEARAKARELAARIAANAPQSNFGIIRALPLIAEANPREGYLMESLMAAIAQGTDDAKDRMRAFLEGRAGKVTD